MKDRIPPHCSTFRFEGNPLIFAATTGHLYILNATAGFIWDTLSSEPDLNRLAPKYAGHFGIPLPLAQMDIAEILANLESLGLLLFSSPGHTAAPSLDQQPEDLLEQPAMLPRSAVETIIFRFYQKSVHLHCHLPRLAASLRPLFAHLSAAQETDPQAENLDLLENEGRYFLLHNGIAVLVEASLDALLTRWKTTVTEICHPSLEWVATVHGAAVADDRGAILMPGEKGAGKSTLCAALICSGYDFVTDDIGLLALPDISLTVSPFPMMIKDGSWEVLKPLYPRLDTLPDRANILGQRLRYLAPPRLPKEPIIPVRAVVFPRYRPDGENCLMAVSSLEALTLLSVEAGFETEAAKIDHFLQWLSRIPKYSLSYRSLDHSLILVDRI